MSRQTKMGKLVKEGMEGYSDEDYDSQEEKELSPGNFEVI